MLAIALFAAPPILTAILFIWHWWRANTASDASATSFDPSNRFNPAFCDILLNQSLTQRGLIAAVLDLCTTGYLRLYRQPLQSDPYILELIKDPADLEPEQQQLVAIFFPKPQLNQQISLFAQTTRQAHDRQNTLQHVSHSMGNQLAKRGIFVTAPTSAKALGLSAFIYLIILIGLIAACIASPEYCRSGLDFFLRLISINVISLTFDLLLGLGLAAAINAVLATFAPRYTRAGNSLQQQILDSKSGLQQNILPIVNQSQLPQNISSVTIPESNLELLQFTQPLLGQCVALGLEPHWPSALAPIFEYQPLAYIISDNR